MIMLILKDKTYKKGIAYRRYVEAGVLRLNEGKECIISRDNKQSFGQFAIEEWPDWMPRTSEKFNDLFHNARSWRRVEKAINLLILANDDL